MDDKSVSVRRQIEESRRAFKRDAADPREGQSRAGPVGRRPVRKIEHPILFMVPAAATGKRSGPTVSGRELSESPQLSKFVGERGASL